jgi:hypothetical protein
MANDEIVVEPRIMSDGRHFYQWQLDILDRHVRQLGKKIENFRWVPHRDQFAWDYCDEMPPPHQ